MEATAVRLVSVASAAPLHWTGNKLINPAIVNSLNNTILLFIDVGIHIIPNAYLSIQTYPTRTHYVSEEKDRLFAGVNS
ncbi:hypothetical protein GCM10025859_48680 [Alicyclobacillus fastidiosus]|nr:hypothetical protein GCM10025859_48680 [Alicyclobacillus fastidiosus]